MKTKIIILNILLTTILTACAQIRPEARITLKVIGDYQKPITGVTVGISTFDHAERVGGLSQEVISKGATAQTDKQGMATITFPSLDGKFSYRVMEYSGYYEDYGGQYDFANSSLGQWQPWNPTVELVLRPIVKPVPMYACVVETHIPRPGKRYGFDLAIGDWVAPTGKGLLADFYFVVTGYAKDFKDNDSKLIISFRNPQDGIQPFVSTPNSKFRSPREAPIDGYQDKLVFRQIRKPGQLSPEWIDDTQNETNYFFRVRTVMDENGKIKNALYGKIYGGFDFGGAVTNCFLKIRSYYLNPEPNSRNMEFDPKQNLFRNLDQFHQVDAP